MFPLKNLARKGLKYIPGTQTTGIVVIHILCVIVVTILNELVFQS